jgi:predicted RNA-binding protein
MDDNMPRYWMAVASYEHVQKAVNGGFVQVCHGKEGPLARMKSGDWVVYYSPTTTFQGKDSCKKFTAVATVLEKEPYQFRMSDDFIPWRRDVAFVRCEPVAIQPLIESLSFIHNKLRWGFPFRRGCFEIPEKDFLLIAKRMKVSTL